MSKTLNTAIKSALESNTIIIGLKRTIKEKKLNKIVISSNCPKEIKDKLKTKEKVPVEIFEGNNAELGELCKKPFSISVLSIKNK